MVERFKLGNIDVIVMRKDIKNIHLSVYPPAGTVRISAPVRMDRDTIRVFAISKLEWIKSQQRKLRGQERETPREYMDRESHYVWGKRYLLKLVEKDAVPTVELKHKTIHLQVRPGTGKEKRKEILDGWYREQLRAAAMPLFVRWEPLLGVKVERLFIQRMKTKWGSCNHRVGNIRLNTDLAKKPPECLEYIVVHELLHLLESTHNSRFVGLMDRFMPKWQCCRDELNTLPVSHEDWEY
jgi:predicted metal-dependent hydrolase